MSGYSKVAPNIDTQLRPIPKIKYSLISTLNWKILCLLKNPTYFNDKQMINVCTNFFKCFCLLCSKGLEIIYLVFWLIRQISQETHDYISNPRNFRIFSLPKFRRANPGSQAPQDTRRSASANLLVLKQKLISNTFFFKWTRTLNQFFSLKWIES